MDFRNFEPCFLIAMPELKDPNFEKTVVLLSDFSDQGAAGFVINRPSNLILGSSITLPDGKINPAYAELRLRWGGPVDPRKIWVVYDARSRARPGDVILGDGIGLAQDVAILTDADVTLRADQLHVIHGYAGWGTHQLETELAASFWITAPVSHDLFFETDTDRVWEKAIERLGVDANKLMNADSPFMQ